MNIIEYNARNKRHDQESEVEEYQIFTHDLIFSIQENYNRVISSCTTNKINEKLQPVVSLNVPLPKINITPFDGQNDKWFDFKSIFDSFVHNNDSPSNIDKFQYLKSYLHGDAAFIVANYQLKDDLYELAYKALHDRYHNQRRLAQLYVDRILDFPKNTSSRKLQSFLTTHTAAINSFKSLKIQDKMIQDKWIFHQALRNLDNSTTIAFEKKMTSQTMPTFQSLIEFVDEACKTQELMTPTPTNSQHRKTTPLLLSERMHQEPLRLL